MKILVEGSNIMVYIGENRPKLYTTKGEITYYRDDIKDEQFFLYLLSRYFSGCSSFYTTLFDQTDNSLISEIQSVTISNTGKNLRIIRFGSFEFLSHCVWRKRCIDWIGYMTEERYLQNLYNLHWSDSIIENELDKYFYDKSRNIY